jgi:perosamine synthetase
MIVVSGNRGYCKGDDRVLKTEKLSCLAVNGGSRLRTEPFPARGSIGWEEKFAVDAVFEQAIKTGSAPGYNGEEEEAYCQEFSAYLGGGFADAVNSGTSAIYVALKALDLDPFTEVIVGAMTDLGGMMPIPLLNLIPMVADTHPGSFNTGPEQVQELITSRTSAILIPHIAGEPADMEGILQVASRHGLPVIEDCAQAHGAKLKGRMLGTFVRMPMRRLTGTLTCVSMRIGPSQISKMQSPSFRKWTMPTRSEFRQAKESLPI